MMPRTGSSGQDSVWVGTFWGFLNVSLCASGTQLGLVIKKRDVIHGGIQQTSLIGPKT